MVLAVEDEPAVLAAAVETLTDLGYVVISARDATEAMERLRRDERVDVLFSDVVMPGGMNDAMTCPLPEACLSQPLCHLRRFLPRRPKKRVSR